MTASFTLAVIAGRLSRGWYSLFYRFFTSFYLVMTIDFYCFCLLADVLA